MTAVHDVTSWDLVSAAQRGDRDAFGEVYERYVDNVFRFVLYRVGDRTLAEDITSETFLRALRRIDSVVYRGRDVGAWLITIARNLILDYWKSSQCRTEVPTVPDLFDMTIGERSTDNEVVERDTAAALWNCVALLSIDQQACLRLRFVLGLSVAETAVAMGRAESAVKGLTHRAVRKLAELLPDEVMV